MPRLPGPAAGSAGRRALFVVLALALAPCGGERAARAQDSPPPDERAAALRSVAELRRLMAGGEEGLETSLQEFAYLGRPALEIKGRAAGADGVARMRDFSVFDRGTGRVVTFVWFPHTSTRQAGEPILPMSEISTRADAVLRTLGSFPRALALESVERYRASGQDSVYYEVRYTAPEDEIRFLGPPVRLLLNASTGTLFRYDLDPEWIAPPAPARARISRGAAERIAAVVLASRDLRAALGPGAVPGKPAAADLFYVRPNGWPGLGEEAAGAPPRVAWVVSVPLGGVPKGAPASLTLHVDAATGKVLGGSAGPPP